MKYDDTSWHLTDEFPEDSPEEYSATHIGLYLKWCFLKGWAGELHTDEEVGCGDVEGLLSGSISATDYFIRYCDGKLTNEDFSDEGNEFAQYCYGDDFLYATDYQRAFSEEAYKVSCVDHDFEALSAMIEKQYQQFLRKKAKAENPW